MMSHRQALLQPMLGPDEERDLVARWRRDRDPAARERLIRSHVRLCYSVASRYDNNEEHVRDLAQEGVFGLMRAVEKFNPACGTRFATYARWWVMTSVGQAAARVASVVDMPSRTFLEARGGGFDNPALAWEARQAARGEVPLDAPVGEDGETTVGDLLRCTAPDPEAAAMQADRAALLRRSIERGMREAMSAREAEVLRRRRLGERGETLDQIARDFGVSRERVRQIEGAAVAKLGRHLRESGFPRHMLGE